MKKLLCIGWLVFSAALLLAMDNSNEPNPAIEQPKEEELNLAELMASFGVACAGNSNVDLEYYIKGNPVVQPYYAAELRRIHEQAIQEHKNKQLMDDKK
jgi:hypothetical protein